MKRGKTLHPLSCQLQQRSGVLFSECYTHHSLITLNVRKLLKGNIFKLLLGIKYYNWPFWGRSEASGLASL